MKKILTLTIGLLTLAGCAGQYDYYTGNVRYYQDGDDCVYSIGEVGEHQAGNIRDLYVNKKIVYRKTLCRDLYAQDTADTDAARRDRRTIVPVTTSQTVAEPQSAPVVEPMTVAPTCPHAYVRRRYVLVPQQM